jgi:hypothetical protein
VARLEPPVLALEPDYEERLRFAAGRHRFVLSLGGLPVEIATDSDGIAGYLKEHFGGFLDDREPSVRLELGEADERAFPFETLVGSLITYARGSHVIGKFRTMAGFIDTARHRGRGLVAAGNYRQDLGNYLRFIIDAMMPPFGAVLFHTAGAARRGHAYLFYGPSTAGKSTITALLARQAEILSDDMLVVRLVDGRLRAATCGFWGGGTTEYPTRRIDLEVRALFRLRKAAEVSVTRIEPARAALDVLASVPNMERPARDREFVLDFAKAAAGSAPFFELAFRKGDDSFWSVIDELA